MYENEKPNKYTNKSGWETYAQPLNLDKPRGYTIIANDVFQKWLRELSPSAYKVAMAIVGATHCFHQDARQLSISYLMKLTDIKSKNTIAVAIAECMAKGIVARRYVNENLPRMGYEYGLVTARMDLEQFPSVSGITDPYAIEEEGDLDISDIADDDNDNNGPDPVPDEPEDNAADAPEEEEEVGQNLVQGNTENEGGGTKNEQALVQKSNKELVQKLNTFKIKDSIKNKYLNCSPPAKAGGLRRKNFEDPELVYEDGDPEDQDGVGNRKRQKYTIPETNFQERMLMSCHRQYFEKGEKSRVIMIEKTGMLPFRDYPNAKFPAEWVEHCIAWAIKRNKEKRYPIIKFSALLNYIENEDKMRDFLIDLAREIEKENKLNRRVTLEEFYNGDY